MDITKYFMLVIVFSISFSFEMIAKSFRELIINLYLFTLRFKKIFFLRSINLPLKTRKLYNNRFDKRRKMIKYTIVTLHIWYKLYIKYITVSSIQYTILFVPPISIIMLKNFKRDIYFPSTRNFVLLLNSQVFIYLW